MRTRIITEPVITRNRGPFSYKTYGLPKWTLTGTGTTSPGGSYVNKEGESQILDDPSPSKRVKTVTHTKWHLSRPDIDHYDEFTNTNRYVYDGPGAHQLSWGSYGRILPEHVAVTYPVTVASLKAQAMHAFFNTNQVDNLLNIAESEQLVGSLVSLGNLIDRLRSGRPPTELLRFADVGRLFSRKGIKSFKALDLSNLYLMWQFGFAPLISDMRKVMVSVKNLKSSLNRAVSDAGKQYSVTAKCFSTDITLVSNLINPLTGYNRVYNPLNSSYWHDQILYLATPVRIVGVSGVRTVKYSLASFQKLDYLMARFLTPGPASFVWERIPFSFVIDWFVDLSGLIDKLNNTLTGGTKQIKKCWLSEKYHLEVRAIKHQTSSWSSDSDGSPTAYNDISYYHREPLDTNISIVPSGRFGKKQALLSAALLHQLVAKLKGH